MSTRAEWIESHVALTKESLAAGDGCHPDEAKALGDYLDNKSNAQDTAKAITAPILQEDDPPAELYRLMGLLCEALVDLKSDCDKLLDLLATIQSLPPTSGINWSRLPSFGNMWSDMYRLYLHGSCDWEKAGESLPVEKRVELYQHYEAVATVEANMYIRGLGGVTADWGYRTLNVVCSGRPGLDVFLRAVHAWLETAGTKLWQDLRAEQVTSWSKPALGGRPGQQKNVQGTMIEHWDSWRSSLFQISNEKDFMSAETRELAAECHKLMRNDL